jgi:hypothetical protein
LPHWFKAQMGVLTTLSREGEVLWEKHFDDTHRGFFDEIVLDQKKLMILGSKEVSGVTPEEEYERGSAAENMDY